MSDSTTNRLAKVELDEASLGRGSPEVEHERKSAIFDLVEQSSFALPDLDAGPYTLNVSLHEGKLLLDVGNEAGPLVSHILSLTPFRRIISEYFSVCDSYYAAIKNASSAQIEAIDMGRRGLHNDGSERLMERLEEKIEIDFDTARRLFTLICVLNWKGSAR